MEVTTTGFPPEPELIHTVLATPALSFRVSSAQLFEKSRVNLYFMGLQLQSSVGAGVVVSWHDPRVARLAVMRSVLIFMMLSN